MLFNDQRFQLLGSIPSVFFKTLPPYTGNGNDLNSSICVTPYWGYQLNIMSKFY